MTVLALSENQTLWSVALGIGVVVILVVVVLMMMLLSFLGDIEAGAGALIETGSEVAENTAAIAQLGATGPVLEMIKDEALIHDGYLRSQV